jgi:DNA invertase Pin-like site-specific DNA recombinase
MKTKNTSFGIPIQKGNLTIYPAIPAEMLRAARNSKLKTAAYVRVSTDSAEQEKSFDLQRTHYEKHIKNNPEYEFAGIYGDDGVSATSVHKRKGFLQMIEDCKAGKIDLILTKSVSRFSRNLGDILHYLNMLNALNPPVEIRSEMENISTFSPMGEMLITVLGIVAQWESQNKSESITWALERLFRDEKFLVPPIYGFTKEKGRDNPLIINETEAEIVRACYAWTLEGRSPIYISNTLNTLGIKGKLGNVKWSPSSVVALISHEKYVGDLIAQKTFTPNWKTHKAQKNRGEKTQYRREEHHVPIVSRLVYKTANKIIEKRKGNTDGLPFLKAVPKGILKGFVSVNKIARGYSLENYIKASQEVCSKEENPTISIFANEVSNFDFRKCEVVSALLIGDRSKRICTIKDGKIIFNAACRKAFGDKKIEILFHPTKSILALRSPIDKSCTSGTEITKPISLSSFVPVVLESAELNPKYQYRMYGTKRTKDGETIMFFDLHNAQIIAGKDEYILPKKYAERYGNDFYENLTTCDVHKIDLEGVWQALQKSKQFDLSAGQVIELTEFCKDSLAKLKSSKE